MDNSVPSEPIKRFLAPPDLGKPFLPVPLTPEEIVGKLPLAPENVLPPKNFDPKLFFPKNVNPFPAFQSTPSPSVKWSRPKLPSPKIPFVFEFDEAGVSTLVETGVKASPSIPTLDTWYLVVFFCKLSFLSPH